GNVTITDSHTPINGRFSACLANPRPLYQPTRHRPPQAINALHVAGHAIKKAALQARPHKIQHQSKFQSNQQPRKYKQNPSKCTFRFFGHLTTLHRNSLKHRAFQHNPAHSTLHISFYRPYGGQPGGRGVCFHFFSRFDAVGGE
ncbi:hypothetical protein, partial [uncultured Alistipes sp.]|uniref:hypothetical protein n=1 Tax=uncultured Alistipes sp. TaxID=538949 RepID=UPI00262D95DB